MSELLNATLNENNYYSQESNWQYMSVSQYKNFLSCEARAMALLNEEWTPKTTTALLVGSYVDAYFEGTLELFKEQHPEILTQKGELRADYRRANEIIARVQKDPLFMEYMSGQKQVIFTAELFGCMWKIKIDSYFPNEKIVDLKCMRSLERIMGVSLVEHWGYDTQMAIYSEVERRANERSSGLPTYLAICTKEEEPNLEIVHVPEWQRQERLGEIEINMPRILAVKHGKVPPNRCGVCDYCKHTKVLTKPIEADMLGYTEQELATILSNRFEGW